MTVQSTTPGAAAQELARREHTLSQRVQHLLHQRPALSPAIILLITVVSFTVVNSRFSNPAALSLLVQQTAVVAALAVGQTLIILTAGIDLSVGAITILSTMVMAPTDRSMPAVRMISVCPTASAATTAVCWTSSESAAGLENRLLTTVKLTTVINKMMARLSAGRWCSRCCTRWLSVCSRRASSCAAAPGVVLWTVIVSPSDLSIQWSAPAQRASLRGVNAGDAVDALVGDQRDTGVEEVEALGRLRLVA